MEEKYRDILLEEINSKIALVLEGHEGLRNEIRRTREELKEEIKLNTIRIDALSDRVDSVEENLSARIDEVEEKLDAVAIDLAAHRRDTELHRGYQVSESHEKKM